MRTTSWVIVSLSTGQAVCETFQPRIIAKLNTTRYKAVPILDWLRYQSTLARAATLAASVRRGTA